MDPLTIAAIGTAVLGGIMSSDSSNKASKRNLQAVRETNQTNVDMTRETNAANALLNQQNLDAQMRMQQNAQNFNSPLTQASLLRQAGLNPALNDSMAGSISASSAPSSIPMQAPHIEAPQQVYSDTYVDSGLRALASAADSYIKSTQGYGMQIDNQTKYEMNLKDLQKRSVEIDSLLENTKLARATRKRLIAEKENIQLSTDVMRRSLDDVVKSTSVQNRLNNANADLALQKVNESKEAVTASELNRMLNKNADGRAEREIRAITAKMYAEARSTLANAKMTENELKVWQDNFKRRYAREFWENKILMQTFNQNETKFPHLLDLLDAQISNIENSTELSYPELFKSMVPFSGGRR